jgi:MFS transporter, OFA family, oxalate/formate antiporter
LNKVQRSPKIFFGWWTVLACGIIGFLGVGFGNMAFSVLFKPIAADLGLDRAVTSVASGMQNAVGGILGPVGGWASDKYGPRLVMLVGVITLALGCIAMFFVNSLWSLLFAWGILVGAGCYLGVTIIMDRAIVNWFIKRSGIAINVKFAIQSLAGLLLLPVIALLVVNQGWRVTCVIAGIIILAVTVPLIWFFVKPNRPEFYGLTPDGIMKAAGENQPANHGTNNTLADEAVDLTLKQTLKTSAYWLIIAIQYMSVFGATMMGAHFVPFLTDRGISTVQAASMMGLLITVGIPARLVAGFMVDRIKIGYLRFLMAAGIFMQAIGIFIFLVDQSTTTIYAWLLLFSIGMGISSGVSLPLQARYFGRKAFGSIMGLSGALQMPVGLVAPSIVGWVYDSSHSYNSIIVLIAILLCISGVVACFIHRPKAPVQYTGTLQTIG